jgi:hypothetical protein
MVQPTNFAPRKSSSELIWEDEPLPPALSIHPVYIPTIFWSTLPKLGTI